MTIHTCLRPAAVALALAGLAPSLHAMPELILLEMPPLKDLCEGLDALIS